MAVFPGLAQCLLHAELSVNVGCMVSWLDERVNRKFAWLDLEMI